MSQEGYRLFINICDLYLVLLQVMLFLVVWDIFFRPEKGKKEMLSAGIFAAVNVLLRLCPGVPGWARYAVSAAAVFGGSLLKIFWPPGKGGNSFGGFLL